MKNLTHSLDGIDNDLIEQSADIERLLRVRRSRKRAVMSSVTGMAACLMLVFGVAALFNYFGSSPNTDIIEDSSKTPAASTAADAVSTTAVSTAANAVNTTVVSTAANQPDKSVFGLPVDNFSLADLDTSSGLTSAVRLVCGNLIDFFLFNQPHAFAYVRVLDTNLQT
ncbi:MAG: hypothetical protein FWF82_07875, partial [Oscillospiraceae bacterium]|nr:hypothetical protein [Oscillospiraceae bacterium]